MRGKPRPAPGPWRRLVADVIGVPADPKFIYLIASTQFNGWS
jgi:hypothetical protein